MNILRRVRKSEEERKLHNEMEGKIHISTQGIRVDRQKIFESESFKNRINPPEEETNSKVEK